MPRTRIPSRTLKIASVLGGLTQNSRRCGYHMKLMNSSSSDCFATLRSTPRQLPLDQVRTQNSKLLASLFEKSANSSGA